MSASSPEEEIIYHAIGDFTTEEEGKVSKLLQFRGQITQLQLSLRCGDEVKVLEKVNDTWWWVEVNGEVGYAPSNHLSSEQSVEWQNDEYFTSYDALVSQYAANLADMP